MVVELGRSGRYWPRRLVSRGRIRREYIELYIKYVLSNEDANNDGSTAPSTDTSYKNQKQYKRLVDIEEGMCELGDKKKLEWLWGGIETTTINIWRAMALKSYNKSNFKKSSSDPNFIARAVNFVKQDNDDHESNEQLLKYLESFETPHSGSRRSSSSKPTTSKNLALSTTAISFSFRLKSGAITFFSPSVSSKPTSPPMPFLEFSYHDLSANYTLFGDYSAWETDVGLGGWEGNEIEQRGNVVRAIYREEQQEQHGQLFTLSIRRNPQNLPNYDYSIVSSLKCLRFVVAHTSTIPRGFKAFFPPTPSSSPSSTSRPMQQQQPAWKKTVSNFGSVTRKQIVARAKVVLSRHKNLHVDIDIDAPIVIIKPDGSSESGISLDLGMISILTERVAGVSLKNSIDVAPTIDSLRTDNTNSPLVSPQPAFGNSKLLTASQLMKNSQLQLKSPIPTSTPRRTSSNIPPTPVSPKLLPSSAMSPPRFSNSHTSSRRPTASSRMRSASNFGASSYSETGSEFAWNYNNNNNNNNNNARSGRRSKFAVAQTLLQENFYDSFSVKLSEIKVQVFADTSAYHLVDNFSVLTTIHKSVIPEDHALSRVKIISVIDTLKCNLTRKNIDLLCDVYNASIMQKQKEPELYLVPTLATPPAAPTRLEMEEKTRARTKSDITIDTAVDSHLQKSQKPPKAMPNNPPSSAADTNSEIFDELQFLDALDDVPQDNPGSSIQQTQSFFSDHEIELDEFMNPGLFQKKEKKKKKRRERERTDSSASGTVADDNPGYLNSENLAKLDKADSDATTLDDDDGVHSSNSSNNSFHSADSSIGDHVVFQSNLESAIQTLETTEAEDNLNRIRNTAKLRALKNALYEIESVQKTEVVDFTSTDDNTHSTNLLFKRGDRKTKEVALRAKALLANHNNQSVTAIPCTADNNPNASASANASANANANAQANRELCFFSFEIRSLAVQVDEIATLSIENLKTSTRIRSYDLRCATAIEKLVLFDDLARKKSPRTTLPLIVGTSANSSSQLASDFPHLLQQSIFPDFESVRSESHLTHNTYNTHSRRGLLPSSSGKFLKVLMEFNKPSSKNKNSGSIKLKLITGSLETCFDTNSKLHLLDFFRGFRGKLKPQQQQQPQLKQQRQQLPLDLFSRTMTMKNEEFPAVAVSLKLHNISSRIVSNNKPLAAFVLSSTDIALARTIAPRNRGQFDVRVGNFQVIELGQTGYEIFGIRQNPVGSMHIMRAQKQRPLLQFRARSQRAGGHDWVIGNRDGPGETMDDEEKKYGDNNECAVWLCHAGVRIDSPCVEFKRRDINRIVGSVNQLMQFKGEGGSQRNSLADAPRVHDTNSAQKDVIVPPKIDFRADLIVRDAKLYLPVAAASKISTQNNSSKAATSRNHDFHDYSSTPPLQITPALHNADSGRSTFLLFSLDYFCSSLTGQSDSHSVALTTAINNFNVAMKDVSHISRSAIELDAPPTVVMRLSNVNLDVSRERSKSSRRNPLLTLPVTSPWHWENKFTQLRSTNTKAENPALGDVADVMARLKIAPFALTLSPSNMSMLQSAVAGVTADESDGGINEGDDESGNCRDNIRSENVDQAPKFKRLAFEMECEQVAIVLLPKKQYEGSSSPANSSRVFSEDVSSAILKVEIWNVFVHLTMSELSTEGGMRTNTLRVLHHGNVVLGAVKDDALDNNDDVNLSFVITNTSESKRKLRTDVKLVPSQLLVLPSAVNSVVDFFGSCTFRARVEDEDDGIISPNARLPFGLDECATNISFGVFSLLLPCSEMFEETAAEALQFSWNAKLFFEISTTRFGRQKVATEELEKFVGSKKTYKSSKEGGSEGGLPDEVFKDLCGKISASLTTTTTSSPMHAWSLWVAKAKLLVNDVQANIVNLNNSTSATSGAQERHQQPVIFPFDFHLIHTSVLATFDSRFSTRENKSKEVMSAFTHHLDCELSNFNLRHYLKSDFIGRVNRVTLAPILKREKRSTQRQEQQQSTAAYKNLLSTSTSSLSSITQLKQHSQHLSYNDSYSMGRSTDSPRQGYNREQTTQPSSPAQQPARKPPTRKKGLMSLVKRSSFFGGFEINNFQVVVIPGDRAENRAPMLRLNINSIKSGGILAYLLNGGSVFSGWVRCEMAADYLNRYVANWEPLVEPWSVGVRVGVSLDKVRLRMRMGGRTGVFDHGEDIDIALFDVKGKKNGAGVEAEGGQEEEGRGLKGLGRRVSKAVLPPAKSLQHLNLTAKTAASKTASGAAVSTASDFTFLILHLIADDLAKTTRADVDFFSLVNAHRQKNRHSLLTFYGLSPISEESNAAPMNGPSGPNVPAIQVKIEDDKPLNLNITSAFLEQLFGEGLGEGGGGGVGAFDNTKRHHKILNKSGLPLRYWVDKTTSKNANVLSNETTDGVEVKKLGDGEEGKLGTNNNATTFIAIEFLKRGGGKNFKLIRRVPVDRVGLFEVRKRTCVLSWRTHTHLRRQKKTVSLQTFVINY